MWWRGRGGGEREEEKEDRARPLMGARRDRELRTSGYLDNGAGGRIR